MMWNQLSEEDYEIRKSTMCSFIDDTFTYFAKPKLCPWSYETVYSASFNSVLHGFGNRLYTDIMEHIGQIYDSFNINSRLQEACQSPSSLADMIQYGHCLNHVRATKYLVTFHEILVQFNFVQKCVYEVNLFMDKRFLIPTLKTDIKAELLKLFMSEVSEKNIKKVVVYALSHPHAISSEMMSQLNTFLFQLNPDFVQNDPNLFEKMRAKQIQIEM